MAHNRISPLAPKVPADLPGINGVGLVSFATGAKYRGRDDLLLVELAPGTAVAGVFTQSTTAAAPVAWCKRALKAGSARALLVNAGNANAFTGRAGESVIRDIAKAVATRMRSRQSEIFLASTGVIGEPLAGAPIINALDEMMDNLQPTGWRAAAAAIMTTDTYPKLASATARIGDSAVRINGIAKGSGMIAPDMATMLAFLFTDAALAPEVLHMLLNEAVDKSFNAITVDGDTSTSDTVLLFATGRAGPGKPVKSARGAKLAAFREALDAVCLDLSHQIVRDGEGAQKFVTIKVTGARSGKAARAIAKSIANSPLVKTAIAGADANWGRIVMAVGKSGEDVNRDRLAIWIGGVRVTRLGAVDPAYREERVSAHMRGAKIEIKVDVAVGRGASTVWTCDLTQDYIAINADYRS